MSIRFVHVFDEDKVFGTGNEEGKRHVESKYNSKSAIIMDVHSVYPNRWSPKQFVSDFRFFFPFV